MGLGNYEQQLEKKQESKVSTCYVKTVSNKAAISTSRTQETPGMQSNEPQTGAMASLDLRGMPKEDFQKVPNEKINHLVLDAVARAVGECVRSKPPSTMTEIAKIIQAAQLAYQHASTKQFKPSTWRISIEQKIDGWKALISLLERAKKFEKRKEQDPNSYESGKTQAWKWK